MPLSQNRIFLLDGVVRQSLRRSFLSKIKENCRRKIRQRLQQCEVSFGQASGMSHSACEFLSVSFDWKGKKNGKMSLQGRPTGLLCGGNVAQQRVDCFMEKNHAYDKLDHNAEASHQQRQNSKAEVDKTQQSAKKRNARQANKHHIQIFPSSGNPTAQSLDRLTIFLINKAFRCQGNESIDELYRSVKSQILIGGKKYNDQDQRKANNMSYRWNAVAGLRFRQTKINDTVNADNQQI